MKFRLCVIYDTVTQTWQVEEPLDNPFYSKELGGVLSPSDIAPWMWIEHGRLEAELSAIFEANEEMGLGE